MQTSFNYIVSRIKTFKTVKSKKISTTTIISVVGNSTTHKRLQMFSFCSATLTQGGIII